MSINNLKSSRKIFVNLAVRDLEKSMEFFGKLGFKFNPKFTDDKAACMIISEDASYAMLLAEPYFKTFTKREVCNTGSHTEAMLAFSCDSRAEVDELVDKAVSAGAKPAMNPQDYGFLYNRSFYDLDGHHWEVMWMDATAVPSQA